MAKKKPAAARAPKAAAEKKRTIAALNARVKQIEGGKLTRQQIRDIEWLENTERARHVADWIQAVPKGDYCKLADRQHKLVDDAARNYSLPLDRPTIDLREALKALHDLIAANASRLKSDLGDDRYELEAEKLRQQIVGIERDNERKLIELAHSRGDAIPRKAVRETLVILSARLRTLGQTIARIDPEARDAVNEFLESLAIEMESGDFSF